LQQSVKCVRLIYCREVVTALCGNLDNHGFQMWSRENESELTAHHLVKTINVNILPIIGFCNWGSDGTSYRNCMCSAS